MREAFTTLAPFDPLITSVMHGGHAKNSAHYAGKAIDVGAFGATGVGWNAPTWDAVVSAIQSGKFTKIGTFKRLAMQAQLQSLAKEYGVELFDDEGSGPHVHFENDRL